MTLPGAARRRRTRWLRSAITDTQAALEVERGADPVIDRATRGTLHALEDELAALRGGAGPPLGARPTNGWTPRENWLARASEATAARLEEPGALATLQAVERERESREPS